MIKITENVSIPETELLFTFIRSPGPGGQNVNKVATAVLLRFNLVSSPSIPEDLRARLLLRLENKITLSGELIVKASSYRTQERNKQDAIMRLQELLKHAAKVFKKRRKTKPTYSSTQKRLSTKKLHGKTKSLRQKKLRDV
ncbi:MAG: alternative ribosome rescue aminoacyl-tRNA hydrolase ArfB [Gammaproteobacteria bacterium]|nr:alternative ribosome rescue aminoacyl-tRNA hydrolase ArfB [Gammaproteobacteria bacterium]